MAPQFFDVSRFTGKSLIYVPIWPMAADDYIVTIDEFMAGKINLLSQGTPIPRWHWKITGPVMRRGLQFEGLASTLPMAFDAFDAAFWAWHQDASNLNTTIVWENF